MRTPAVTQTHRLVVPLALLLGLALIAPAPVHAAVLTVTDCGGTGGFDQLRALVTAAADRDVILIPACTITLGTRLVVTASLLIQGTGATRTTIVSDNTGTEGGGIFTYSPLTLWRSTVSGNRATLPQSGGGGVAGFGPFHIISSTLSGNTAAGNSGGGGLLAFGPATLVTSTVVDNRAPTGPGGGIRNGWTDKASLINTIVAGNTAASGANCSGTITSAGHNLDSGITCGLGNAGDLANTDPQLGPLQDNGGPAPTHALLADSPAIDAGDATGCPGTAQRGVRRPQGAGCDIGAVEARRLVPRVGSGVSGGRP